MQAVLSSDKDRYGSIDESPLPSPAALRAFFVIADSLKLSLRLMIFSGGPEDLPYAPQVTQLLAAFCVATSTLMLQFLLPLPVALGSSIAAVAAVALFNQTLLRLRRLEPRLAQTLAAHYATSGLFALMMTPVLAQIAPTIQELMNNPELLEKVKSGAAKPSTPAATFIADILFFWSLLVTARIYRAAANLRFFGGVVVTVSSLFVVLSFFVFSQALLIPLFK
jgi:hypothetical protein